MTPDISRVEGALPEQNEGTMKDAGRLANAPDQALAPVARELDGQVAVLTMQHRPHNFIGAKLWPRRNRKPAARRSQRSPSIERKPSCRSFM
jgi:hypothetical protein